MPNSDDPWNVQIDWKDNPYTALVGRTIRNVHHQPGCTLILLDGGVSISIAKGGIQGAEQYIALPWECPEKEELKGEADV